VVTDSWARGVYFIVLKDAVQGSTSLPVFVQ
jgi:hypothetical protein